MLSCKAEVLQIERGLLTSEPPKNCAILTRDLVDGIGIAQGQEIVAFFILVHRIGMSESSELVVSTSPLSAIS